MHPRARVLSWCALILALPLIPSRPDARDVRRETQRSYDREGLRLAAGPAGTEVSWEGLALDRTGGRPALPVDRWTFEPPEGYRLKRIDVEAVGWETLPVTEPVVSFPGPAPPPTPGDGNAAAGGPPPDAEMLAGGFLRGTRLETVEFRPVRHRPGSGEVEIASGFTVLLEFEPDPSEPVVSRRRAWAGEDAFETAAARLTGRKPPGFEPGGLRTLVNGQEPFAPRFTPSEDGSPVRYLIITDDASELEYQRLADWKTAVGTPAVVRTLTWIRDNYPHGVDESEEVRGFIRDAVELWGVEYVLLGGDVDQVPIRYAWSYFYGGEFIPTDLYYTCLDGNWNANGNHLFAEPYFSTAFTGDGADFLPDVWVGRVPSRTPLEARNYVDKILDYETAIPLGAGFATGMLCLGEMLFPQNWSPGDSVLFDGALVCEDAVARTSPPIVHQRMYENYFDYPGSVPENKPDAIAAINSGYNMILHVGHGFRNTMAVGLNGEALNNGDADAFHNGVRQGMLYAINCTSAALDFDCIAEHFIRNPNGGGVASVGSTRLDFPATGWDYQNEFFDLVYSGDVTRMGVAAAQQKIPFASTASRDGEHRWTQFSLIFLGDPDMNLYTDAVDAMSVSVVEPFVLGQGTYTVQVTDGAGPVEGAVVCLNKAGDAYGWATTNAAGTAVVAFDPDLPGSASLGVRADNHLSRVDSVTVGASADKHLFLASLIVDDTSGGDGDSLLEAGETAFLFPAVGNQGMVVATGVSLSIVAAPAGITVLDGVSGFADVLPGSTEAALDPLHITVGAAIDPVSLLSVTLELTADGYTRQEPLVLYAGGPSVEHIDNAVTDTVGNGNGNGTLEAGEDQHLAMTATNSGLGRSTGLTGVLTTSDPAVTILDDSSIYGDLEPGQTAAGDGFSFRFADASLGHTMQLTLSDQRGPFLVKTFELQPPATPLDLTAEGGASSITLRWTPPADEDVGGYAVYRSPAPGGPFVRVNEADTGPISYYKDEKLPELTRYYYRVAAVDSSGNEGAQSGVAEATTSLPAHPGFPLAVSASVPSSPCIGYFNGDTKSEIIAGGSEIHVTLDDGIEYIDGDGNAQTYGIFDDSGYGPFWAPPSVADLDGDGRSEIVAAGWTSGFLLVWDSKGNIRPGFPKNLNIDASPTPNVWSASALADVDGDGQLEIFINAGRYTFAFNADGTEVVDGDSDPLTDGVFLEMGASFNYGTPAIADVDNDTLPEIIVGSRDGNLYVMEADGSFLPGFPFATGGDITSSPAIGDLDKDGFKEMVVPNGNFQVHAVDVNLNQPPGWPVGANMNLDYDASPALADLDGDTFLDVVVCAGNGTVFIFRGQNGQILPGWPFILYDSNGFKVGLSSSPAVGNLDDDPEHEICFGANDGNLYAFNLDASLVDGFPIGTNNQIEGGPILWDIDDDGLTEVVAQSLDENVYVWDSPGVFDPDNQPWPMFCQNTRRTGEVSSPVWERIGTPQTTPSLPVLAPNYPNPFAARTTIGYTIPGTTGPQPVQLQIFDIEGRLVRTLARGPAEPGFHEVAFDGRGEDGRVLGAGVYFYRLRVAGNSHTRKLVLLP